MAERPKLHLRLFGSFFCSWSDGREVTVTGAKHRALLAMLAIAANGTHSRAWLQEHLWDRSGEELGRASLRRALSNLRQTFDDEFDGLFDVSNIDLRLRPDRVSVEGTPASGLFLDGLVIREPAFEHWLADKRESYAAGRRQSGFEVRPHVIPTLAVIPFIGIDGMPQTAHFGDLLSLEVTRAVSRSKMIDVISHLSCRQFTGTMLDMAEIRRGLAVEYVIHGSVRTEGGRFRLDADFIDTATGHIVWTRSFTGATREVLMGDADVARQIAAQAGQSILRASVELSRSRPLPEVESHALFMASIAQMHQHRLSAFAQARSQLEALIERVPDESILHAWLAKWYVLAISQGWSSDPAKDIRVAGDATARALDINPYCALSLTVDGMLKGGGGGDEALAQSRFTEATQINPNQGLAWLMFSRMHSFLGNGPEAVRHAQRASALSPLDPHRYFYDIMLAGAHMVNGDYELAKTLANRSIEANPRHTSSYRVSAITHQLAGDGHAAREAVARLRQLEPDLTVSSYLATHQAGATDQGRVFADALRSAGLPEH